MQGAPYKALYIIIDGNCSGEMSDESGKLLKIEDFYAPYTIASAMLFADDNRIPVTVTTRSPVRLLVIRKEDLLLIAQKNIRFMDNLLKDIANKFLFISSKLYYFKFNTLNEKILAYLKRQKKDSDGFVQLRHTVFELANLFGVERPSLSRALSRMEKDGILLRNDKRFKIVS
jgi:CRP-like cAMP-binding protein